MSAEEFLNWMAFWRQGFVGSERENWKQAALAREVNRLIPRKKGDKMPPLTSFLWKPPKPLIVERLEKAARRKKSRNEK